MTISFDPTLLQAAVSQRYGLKTSTALATTQGTSGKFPAPPAPWTATPSKLSSTSSAVNGVKASGTRQASSATAAPSYNTLINRINSGVNLVDPSAVRFSTTGISSTQIDDYRALFALHTALNNLSVLAHAAADPALSATERAQIQAAFAKGQDQVTAFLDSHAFNQFSLAEGKSATSASADQIQPGETDVYAARTLFSGSISDAPTALSGPLSFDLAIRSAGKADATLHFDLVDMGDTPRTAGNVVNYMNAKLAAAGYATRFAITQSQDPASPTSAPTQLVSLQIRGASYETLSFSDPAASTAVYVAQSAGASTTKSSGGVIGAQPQLLKIDASLAATSPSGAQVFNQTLPASAIHGVATAADGSVYVLSDAVGTTGASDIVLSRYDPAGQLVYSRSLGARASATSYALSVSPDGSRVAVAGTVTGALDTANPATANAGSDTVVTTYSTALGQEVWTRRLGSKTGDDHPTAVTFGADNAVYVTGQTTAPLTETDTQHASTDNYLIALTNAGDLKFQTQYGGPGGNHASGVAVTGDQVVVAGVENGHAILRAFNTTGPLTATSVRDLGDLQGGDIAGLVAKPDGGLLIAGSTHSGSLAAGKVLEGSDGGRDLFVANLADGMTANAADAITYKAQPAVTSTSAVTLSHGLAYIAGQTTTDSGVTDKPDHAGFIAAIDPSTGQTSWTRSFAGLDGQDAIAGVAVADKGVSSLDRLGLPSGTVGWSVSDRIVDFTNVRPGDSFQVVANGVRAKVTVDITDTFATLAAKINRASGFAATASSVFSLDGRQLSLKPTTPSAVISIEAGPRDSNALVGLGLAPTVISAGATASSVTTKAEKSNVHAMPYSLQLSGALGVGTAAEAQSAEANLSGAMSTLKGIYQDLTSPKQTSTTARGASRPVPAYLTRQLANYKQGLARLSQVSGG